MAEMREVGFISCVVKPENFEKAAEHFAKTYGGTRRVWQTGSPTPRDDMWIGTTVTIAGLNLQIMTPTAEGSVLDRFLKTRGEGLYAIRFNAVDFEGTMKECESMDLRVVGVRPGVEFFVHPKDNFGIMIEIGPYRGER